MPHGSHVAIRVCCLTVLLCAIPMLTTCGGSGSDPSNGQSPPPPPPNVTVSVTPHNAALAVGGTKQFTATVTGDPNDLGVTWSVDGVNGGDTTVGLISASGVYTPPSSGGSHSIVASSVANSAANDSASVFVTDLAGVFTYHNNLSRDGTNTREYVLNPSNVNSTSFGKLFSCGVDGAVYAQPLWVPNLSVNGSVHNVVFVATAHDSLYAFDADTSPCVQLWHANLLDSGHGATASETPVLWSDLGTEGDIFPEVGVIGTPVIDVSTMTMYVVSKSQHTSANFFQRLHAINLLTGSEKFGGPVDISASVAGSGAGSVAGSVSFNPRTENQRCALALVNGTVYIAWASHEDVDPYHGWLIGYSAGTLAVVSTLNSTPDGARGGIWMSGGALSADSSGNLYLSTGNGTFDGDSGSAPNSDFGNTILKLDSSGLATLDWFTPFNEAILSSTDKDLGSGGAVLLPDQPSGPVHHLLVEGGKRGVMYLLDRDNLGHFQSGSDSQIVQSWQAATRPGTAVPAVFGSPVFWQNGLYHAGRDDALKRYAFDPTSGKFSTSPASQSAHIFPFPGAIPSLSSQGSLNGIVWAIDSSTYGFPSSLGSGPAVLHAYDATNLANELWNSAQAANHRDAAGNAVKFTVPTIANGNVYIGTRTELDVYGLLP